MYDCIFFTQIIHIFSAFGKPTNVQLQPESTSCVLLSWQKPDYSSEQIFGYQVMIIHKKSYIFLLQQSLFIYRYMLVYFVQNVGNSKRKLKKRACLKFKTSSFIL